jgi:hypothetical protein
MINTLDADNGPLLGASLAETVDTLMDTEVYSEEDGLTGVAESFNGDKVMRKVVLVVAVD